MSLYDTHCHPYLLENKNSEKVLEDFSKNPENILNCIWVDLESSLKSVKLAKEKNFVFATIWIHPSYAKNYIDSKKEIFEDLEELYLQNKEEIVWIGECWLDYFYLWERSWNNSIIINDVEEKTLQKEFFINQIRLAKKYNLPIIIHNREARDDVFEILQNENFKNFLMHCYTEDLDFALKLINFAPECKISFSGIVTFNSAKSIQDTAKNIPLKNILIETDSPYLTPIPFRWKEENEPIFVKYVLEKIISLRTENKDEIEKQIFQNSLDFFGSDIKEQNKSKKQTRIFPDFKRFFEKMA